MFDECCFLLGEGSSVIIVIPEKLPDAETYTVSLTTDCIRFKAGYDAIAQMNYSGDEVFKRLSRLVQVGLVEYKPSEGPMPDHITNVAYVEVRSSM
jgi:hypothetical protein